MILKCVPKKPASVSLAEDCRGRSRKRRLCISGYSHEGQGVRALSTAYLSIPPLVEAVAVTPGAYLQNTLLSEKQSLWLNERACSFQEAGNTPIFSL